MDSHLILKHLNLLLVDDSRKNNEAFYSVFSGIFHHITLAGDAETALKLYHSEPIDIIITDIQLPGMDGLSLVEQIRAINATIPIIVLSAYTYKEYLLRAANLQIDGYISKPLRFSKINSALARTVTRLGNRVKPVYLTDNIVYHPLHKNLQVDHGEVSLGNKECLLLDLLLLNTHRVVKKGDIFAAVWPNEIVSESALKNLLGELRKKLKYPVIQNRHGQGWILAPECL